MTASIAPCLGLTAAEAMLSLVAISELLCAISAFSFGVAEAYASFACFTSPTRASSTFISVDREAAFVFAAAASALAWSRSRFFWASAVSSLEAAGRGGEDAVADVDAGLSSAMESALL